MNWLKWVVIADLVFSGLVLITRQGKTRTYTTSDVVVGVVEIGIICALVVAS